MPGSVVLLCERLQRTEVKAFWLRIQRIIDFASSISSFRRRKHVHDEVALRSTALLFSYARAAIGTAQSMGQSIPNSSTWSA